VVRIPPSPPLATQVAVVPRSGTADAKRLQRRDENEVRRSEAKKGRAKRECAAPAAGCQSLPLRHVSLPWSFAWHSQQKGWRSMAALRSSAQAERSRAKPTPIRTLTGPIGHACWFDLICRVMNNTGAAVIACRWRNHAADFTARQKQRPPERKINIPEHLFCHSLVVFGSYTVL